MYNVIMDSMDTVYYYVGMATVRMYLISLGLFVVWTAIFGRERE